MLALMISILSLCIMLLLFIFLRGKQNNIVDTVNSIDARLHANREILELMYEHTFGSKSLEDARKIIASK
jgi:hypothetical protein